MLVAVGKTLGSVSENLMIFFLVPLCVGLYCRLRYEAGLQERVLTIAVLVVNCALMLGRYVWVEPGSTRRYSVGLIVLIACYIPAGLALMARWLRMALDRLLGDRGQADLGERVWFGALLAVGVAICIPKLLTPLGAGKPGYREAARWLQNNTPVEAIVAVSDERITFYAERQSRFYQEHADPRKADYVVIIASDASPRRIPEGWSQRHSCRINKRRREKLVIYRIP